MSDEMYPEGWHGVRNLIWFRTKGVAWPFVDNLSFIQICSSSFEWIDPRANFVLKQ